MNRIDPTKRDGPKLICRRTFTSFTQNNIYYVLGKGTGALADHSFITCDNDKFTSCSDIAIDHLFIPYNSLTEEQKVLFQLHRDVDQLQLHTG